MAENYENLPFFFKCWLVDFNESDRIHSFLNPTFKCWFLPLCVISDKEDLDFLDDVEEQLDKEALSKEHHTDCGESNKMDEEEPTG